jgi:hypothetical protein
MILFVLACFGGVLTVVSPRILPVLPFVFARRSAPLSPVGCPFLDPGVQVYAFIFG